MKIIRLQTDLGRRILFMLIVWLVGSVMVKAQDNPYKIDNELYHYFVRIMSKIQQPDTQATIDSMYTKAVQKSDVKAQCIAIAIRCKNLIMNNQIEKAKQTASTYKKIFFQSKQEQYYYYAISCLIDHYINQKQYDKAIVEVNNFKDEAFKAKNDYAISLSFRILGKIYFNNDEIQRAIEYYLMSASYLEKVGLFKELDQCYVPLASIYYELNDFDKASFYADKAKTHNQDKNRLVILYLNLLHRLIDNKMETKADTLFKECKDIFENNIMALKNVNAYYHEACKYYSMKGDYTKSLTYADSISDLSLSSYLKSTIYAEIADYKQAYLFLKKNENFVDSVNKKVLADALSQSSAQLNAQRLQLENNRLELQNAKMKLKQSEDFKRLLTMESERNLLSLNNTQLELNNKTLMIQQSEMKIKQKEQQLKTEKERNEAEKEASLTRTILLYIISFSFLFSALLTLLYFHRRNIIIRSLKKEKAKAESADRLKSQFLQNMSHEIRTPLNAIVGFTDLLNDSDADFSEDERNEFLKLIHTNSELLTTLINDILDVSKLESGNYTLNITNTKVAEICTSSISSVMHKVAQGVDMYFETPTAEISLPDGTPAAEMYLNTDAARLQQILTNFLTNACKYTEKGFIVLTYSIQKNELKDRYEVVFSVTDTGTGIPTDKAETIFERFSKLDSFKQGTGLGLNICKRISDLLDGEVKVDTNYTNGARFIFVHPLV